MTIKANEYLNILTKLSDPFTKKNYLEKAFTNININSSSLEFDVELPYPLLNDNGEKSQELLKVFKNILPEIQKINPAINEILPKYQIKVSAHKVQQGVRLLPDVKNIIAVASGKGGVGKSTTTVNLAIAMAQAGAKVGVLDADIYGPSIPQMLGLPNNRPEMNSAEKILPLSAHGIKAMSIGFMIESDTPMIWRGPMASQALEQIMRDTLWGELDYLFVDMPPGTGDIQLTLSQKVPLTGAVIVTTPQDIALIDARKGLKMFEKVSVPILGIVENMSIYVCPKCNHQEHIFGEGGAQKMRDDYQVNVLGNLPLSINIREQVDSGKPTTAIEPNSVYAKIYQEIAHKIAVAIALRAKNFDGKLPNIVVQN